MQLIKGLENAEKFLMGRPTAVTIGNFDGCHLGHRRLLDVTVNLAKSLNCVPIALTMSPRPEVYLRGDGPERDLLFSPAQKTRALGEAGLACHVEARFDAAFAALTPEEFVSTALKRSLNAKAVVVGANFRFGRDRQGHAPWLVAHSIEFGFEVVAVDQVCVGGIPVSSTRIRECLTTDGAVASARHLLGRPYLAEGVVRRGRQMGRQLGFPTANLATRCQILPKNGVYAGWFRIDRTPSPQGAPLLDPDTARLAMAVCNIGTRPTVSPDGQVTLEVHVLDQTFGADELYDAPAGFYFADRIRDERKFPDIEALRRQIGEDVESARVLLGIRA